MSASQGTPFIKPADLMQGFAVSGNLPNPSHCRIVMPAKIVQKAAEGICTGWSLGDEVQHPVNAKRTVGHVHEVGMALLAPAVGGEQAGNLIEQGRLVLCQTRSRVCTQDAQEPDVLTTGGQQRAVNKEPCAEFGRDGLVAGEALVPRDVRNYGQAGTMVQRAC